jgi:hypothetical protein
VVRASTPGSFLPSRNSSLHPTDKDPSVGSPG